MPQGKPAHIFCDNKSVVKNTTNVELTLSKDTLQWRITIVGGQSQQVS